MPAPSTTTLLSEEGFVVSFTNDTGEDQQQAFKQCEFERRFFANATNQSLCKTLLENALRDPVSGEIGKSIVFAVSQNPAAKLTQIFNLSEADLLNVALFGQTAKQWRDLNPKLEDNMREYATIEQLLVLANIEGMNAEFIHMALTHGEPLKRLNEIAIRPMQVLTSAPAIKQLKG